MARLQARAYGSTEEDWGESSPRCAGSRLGDSKAVVVLGLGTLQPNILSNRLVEMNTKWWCNADNVGTDRGYVCTPTSVSHAS